MSYFDDESKEKYIPYVIEPSLGADRVVLAFLCAAYDEEELEGGDVRTDLHRCQCRMEVKNCTCIRLLLCSDLFFIISTAKECKYHTVCTE